MVAILEIGALISSLVVGRIGDIIGRRKTIFYGSCVFVVGGALQAFALDIPMMLVGRILAGLGVGMLSTIVPVYQSEISPPHNRGKLACIEFSGNIIGYATSVWVDYFCSFIESNLSWRLPLLMQCIMGTLLGLGSLIIVESPRSVHVFSPDSSLSANSLPRWLLDNDHDEEGIVVIANLYGGGDIHHPRARDEFRDIKMNVLLARQEGERTYRDMFKRYGTRVFIAMSAQALAQLNGINVISYYAPLVFEAAGWRGRDAVLMTGINGITYFLSTIPPWYIVDRWGRRPILLSGAVAMAISLSLISYYMYLNIPSTPTMVVIMVMIYNAAFGYSWGPVPWLYPPEILPLKIRSKGASLSTATNWACNWLVGEMTPILQDAIEWRVYLIHAFFCVVSFVVGRSPRFPLLSQPSPHDKDLTRLRQCTSSIPKRAACASRTWTRCLATLQAPLGHRPRRQLPRSTPSRTRLCGPARPYPRSISGTSAGVRRRRGSVLRALSRASISTRRTMSVMTRIPKPPPRPGAQVALGLLAGSRDSWAVGARTGRRAVARSTLRLIRGRPRAWDCLDSIEGPYRFFFAGLLLR